MSANDATGASIDSTPDSRAASAEQPDVPPHPHHRGVRLSIRAGIGITLIAVWSIATLTGVLLYVTPEGRRSGQNEVLLGLTKSTWGDVHWWISLAAVAFTVVHVIIDWKTFRSCVRHVVHADGASLPAT